MPYEIERKQGEEARKELQSQSNRAQRCGRSINIDNLEKVEELVITGSSFKDPGEDWCEYEAMSSSGETLHKFRVRGF